MENKTFSIMQVSEKTGVSQKCTRDWHAKGLLPQVEWINVGTRQHRRFSQSDVRTVMRIKDYQDQGFVLRVAAEKAVEK